MEKSQYRKVNKQKLLIVILSQNEWIEIKSMKSENEITLKIRGYTMYQTQDEHFK